MCVILQEWLNCAINMDHLLHSLRHVHVRSFLSFTKDDKNSHTVSHCRSSLRLDGPANFVNIYFFVIFYIFCQFTILSYFCVVNNCHNFCNLLWIYSEIISEIFSDFISWFYYLLFSDFYSEKIK